MAPYKVVILPTAEQDIRDIFSNSAQQGRWSFSETYEYVEDLKKRLATLSENPERFSKDEYTTKKREYRSFQHGSHKAFYTVDPTSKTVHVAAVLPSMTKYSKNI